LLQTYSQCSPHAALHAAFKLVNMVNLIVLHIALKLGNLKKAQSSKTNLKSWTSFKLKKEKMKQHSKMQIKRKY
jgi:hypothetical protein